MTKMVRETGTITTLHPSTKIYHKGFGSITPKGKRSLSGHDLFVDCSNIKQNNNCKSLVEGSEVTYERRKDPDPKYCDEFIAINVTTVSLMGITGRKSPSAATVMPTLTNRGGSCGGRGKRPLSHSYPLFVDNLNKIKTTRIELEKHFRKLIVSIPFFDDVNDGKCFVYFTSADSAYIAFGLINGTELNGNKLRAYCPSLQDLQPHNTTTALVERTPKKLMNLDSIFHSWSPFDKRVKREEGKSKIRSLDNKTRKIRGGDFVFSREKALTTLAVAWKGPNNRNYGLTVAHLEDGRVRLVGDSMFAFDSDDEVGRSPSGEKTYKTVKIGAVVSIDISTDSAVFEIFEGIKTDPLIVALSGSDDHLQKIVLPVPGSIASTSLEFDEAVVMYGATHRGMIGRRVRTTSKLEVRSASFSTQSYQKNEDGRPDSYGATKLTDYGDCGALSLDKNGTPQCMHTTITESPFEDPTLWTSRASCLQNIVNAHPFYFGGHIPPNLCHDSNSLLFESQARSPNLIDKKYPCIRIEFPEDEYEDERNEFFQLQPGLRMFNIEFPDEGDTPAIFVEEEKKMED